MANPKFTSHFWEARHEALGTKLRLSSAYRSQINGLTERTIQSLEDLLQACVLDNRGSWDDLLPLIEFTHASVGMTLYEALYGGKCRTPLYWYQDKENLLVGLELLQEPMKKVKQIRDKIKTSQSRQKSYTDQHRRTLEFEEGDHVFI